MAVFLTLVNYPTISRCSDTRSSSSFLPLNWFAPRGTFSTVRKETLQIELCHYLFLLSMLLNYTQNNLTLIYARIATNSSLKFIVTSRLRYLVMDAELIDLNPQVSNWNS